MTIEQRYQDATLSIDERISDLLDRMTVEEKIAQITALWNKSGLSDEKRAGDEVVQLYIRDRVSSVTRPVKELRGFQRMSLKPGETTTVELPLGPDALAFYDEHMNWVVEPGFFDVMVGPNSEQLTTVALEVLAK